MSLAFIAEAELNDLGMGELRADCVALQNPLSEKFAIMRPSVLPSMLAAVARNIRHGNTDVRAFELGNVYRQSSEELPDQHLNLAIVLSGIAEPENWARQSRPVDFYDLKGYLEATFDFLNIGDVSYRETDAAPFQAGQAGDIYVGELKVGSIGEIRPEAGRALDVDQSIFALEIQLDDLLQGAYRVAAFQAIPAYPATGRDVAVLVERNIPAKALVDAVQKVGGRDLRAVELIDVYWGKPIPAGKKSVALRLTYQSTERTLTDTDTEKSWKKVVRALEQECGAQLR
jgi:phenylalanyl-tRNA synthetase beta chain